MISKDLFFIKPLSQGDWLPFRLHGDDAVKQSRVSDVGLQARQLVFRFLTRNWRSAFAFGVMSKISFTWPLISSADT
jgi:hypothetical protein